MYSKEDNIGLEFREDHIRIWLGPGYETTPEANEKFWKELAEACEKYDCTAILVEGITPRRTMDSKGVLDSGVRLSAIAPKLSMALCLEDYELTEMGELFKTVARSRGARVKFFSDRERALRWLRSRSDE